jgi:phosphate transport system protein
MPMLHTDSLYESELSKLREAVLLMGAKCQEVVTRALAALASREVEVARELIPLDAQIDQLEVRIDDLALMILARRQPVAKDLRFIASVLKMVTDLERIGDLGVNICERVVEICQEPTLAEQEEITTLGVEVTRMLQDALNAFAAGDATLAREVLARDEAVDESFVRIFHSMVACMMKSTGNIERATSLQSLARYLERIADHATNIAEMVVFMVKGQDVRHAPR